MRGTKDRHCGRCGKWNGHTKKHMKLLLRRRINGMFWSIGVRASRYNLSEWLPRQRSFETVAEMIWTLFLAGPLATPRLHKRFQFARVSDWDATKKKDAVPVYPERLRETQPFFFSFFFFLQSALLVVIYTVQLSSYKNLLHYFQFSPHFCNKRAGETGKSSQIRWNWLLHDF